MKYKILRLFLLSFLISCSQVSLIDIKSSPDGTNVYARASSSKDRELIGQTPLVIESSEIQKKLKTNGLIIIELENDDYKKEEIYLSQIGSQQVELNFSLKRLPKIEQSHKVDDIVQELFQCQKYIKVKRFDDCQNIITKLKNKYPEVSSVHEFEGSIFFLKNEKNKALQSFLTALKYNDKNEEARRMIQIIRNN